MQFLLESLLICVSGSLLGLVLGTVCGNAALLVAEMEIAFKPSTPVICALLESLCGLASGA